MLYAKLNNGVISFAPKNKNGIINYNLATNLLLKDGYKPFIEAEKPKSARLYKIIYYEDENNIYEKIEYIKTQSEYEKRNINNQLKHQIEQIESEIKDIDFKRIRAICEPEIKDEETGEIWLEYYNSQVCSLRMQMQNLMEQKRK